MATRMTLRELGELRIEDPELYGFMEAAHAERSRRIRGG